MVEISHKAAAGGTRGRAVRALDGPSHRSLEDIRVMLTTTQILRRAIEEHGDDADAAIAFCRSLKNEENGWRALRILRKRRRPGHTRFVMERNGLVRSIEDAAIPAPERPDELSDFTPENDANG
jgi:hypothetical protein